MVPGQYCFVIVSLIEECRYYLCKKEDHTRQYVVLNNEVKLSPFLSILLPWLLLVFWRSRQYVLGISISYYCCCYFLILREALMFILLKFSGYQFQDMIDFPPQVQHFSFPGDVLMLLHILLGVKVSAKRGLKHFLFNHWRYRRYYSYGLWRL
jgi:hypothetical protein